MAARRTAELIDVLRRADVAFEAPSSLPGWSRLTIVCHLRDGAAAHARARATISGTRRDLLALLLGRRRRRPLEIHGDLDFGAAFERAFPGP